ncbi:hypothetical protein SASPL_133297 [Salvia splendens]|uniref:Endoplasmic reticulum metallopeptidase 1 n=1 Tax=Salvia splendens TaxID=180675 RepID=A0A8X8X120_SALSN|nr:hypothetical protein SASPL_133297 [Salvia splendens]
MSFMRLSAGDVAGFKVLFALMILYGVSSYFAYSAIHMKFVAPLAADAPLDRFSEARAIEHVRVLAEEIGGRQVGTPGLQQAAEYIKKQLELLKERAGSNIRIEIEETVVNGSFNMMFLGNSLSLTYRNHTNIVMRISSVDSQESDPSVLLNGHFDTPPGSPGAGDCGSCVASLLELARLGIDSGWTPPRPIIFLFNGAEELFMLGSHGFMTTHRWRDTIGAFIDIEASGTGGFDLVCQSGPGSWPSSVYAQSAIYPMANSAAQDVFGAVPGDTDYRMFATDYGDIPGLDIIFLLGGYYYHTSYDTVDRLLPGSMQARGDNLFSLMKAFANSSNLLTAQERKSLRDSTSQPKGGRPIYFDYFARFLVLYSRRQALVYHTIPFAIFLLMPLLLRLPTGSLYTSFNSYCDFLKGLLCHACGITFAILLPISLSVLRLLFSGHSMNWFANPFLAFLMFVPCSIVGLLAPTIIWREIPLSQDVLTLALSREELADEARFWGAFGFYNLLTLVSSIICDPFGYFVPDAIVAAVVGLVTGWCLGPCIPVVGKWLAKPRIIQVLLHGSVIAMALSSQFFPYSNDAPKRVVFQHTVQTIDADQVSEVSFDFAVVDSNSLMFVFHHAPDVVKELYGDKELSFDTVPESNTQRWTGILPINALFSRSLKFPKTTAEIMKEYSKFPLLTSHISPSISTKGSRRVNLEFSLGSLKEVWVAVLNITGPLSNWSFADNIVPAPLRIGNGPPSYACRLSGTGHENWTFWLEANTTEPLRIDVAVLDLHITEQTKELKGLFPSWMDVTAFTSFLSSYTV